MRINARQAMIVSVTMMVLTILIACLGIGFPSSTFGRATVADHSVHIAIWMGFFIAVVSFLYRFIQLRSESWEERPGTWTLALLLVYVLAGFLLFSEWLGLPFTKGYWHLAFKVVALFCPLVFLLLALYLPFLRSVPASPTSPAEVRKWGRLVAVLITLLAMFAFGIEVKEEQSKDKGIIRSPTVRWTELPAILIVFVLADFGLELVVLSMESDEKIRSAAKTAIEAAAGAESAVGKLAEANEALNNANSQTLESVKTLQTWVGVTHDITEHLLRGDIHIPKRLAMKDKEYFDKLFCFSRSWVPCQPTGEELPPNQTLREETGRLLGDLFAEFVGRKEEDGTVRRSPGGICCITADSVYAEASKRWLEKITKDPDKPELVVYALTTLLPSEFAFPSAYRGQGDDPNASRISSLHRFSSAVLSSCAGSSVSEYRRITVFEQEKVQTFDRLASRKEGVACNLDTWFILDPRVFHQNAAHAERIWADFLRVAEGEFNISPLSGITRTNLSKVFQVDTKENGPPIYADLRSETFPYYGGLNVPSVFRVELPEGRHMAVFGPVSVTHPGPRRGATACQEWLKCNGWLSLREWYCKRLHKSPDGREGAWWAVLNKSSTSIVESFTIDWDTTTPVTALDVLLIGSRGGDRPIWYGAAISNLAFNRTECTVQLVTSEERLKSMGEAVEQLCNGFRKPSAEQQFPLQSFGTWQEWPVPEWTSTEARGSRGAAAADSR